MHRVLVGEIRGTKAIPPLVSIIGDVERVHGLDRNLLSHLLDLSWVLSTCDQLLLLVGVQELAALSELPQFQFLDGHPVFA